MEQIYGVRFVSPTPANAQRVIPFVSFLLGC